MKKTLIGGFVIALLIMIGVSYAAAYPIKSDFSNLKEGIVSFHKRGNQSGSSLSVEQYNAIELGKKAYVLVEVDGGLGCVTLAKGLTGQYQLEYMRYGETAFREGVVESEGKKYLLVAGKNPSLNIASITATFAGTEYTLEVPEEEIYLVYTEVDANVEADRVGLENFKFWDAQNQDITEELNIEGGGGI